MKYLTASFLLLFGLTQLTAQQPYPHLKTFQLPNEYCGDEPYFKIHYDENLADIVNIKRNELSKDHELYVSDYIEEYDIITLKLRFNSNELNGAYYLVFSTGPSCDPGFYIIDSKTNETIGRTWGMEIYVPGSNSIYTSGHINSAFNKRRKYSFNGTKFEEVKPEFYYVGLKTKTLKPLTIYTTADLNAKLAQLPANYDVEVLVAQRNENYGSNSKYLVKTAVGLVGWAEIEAGPFVAIDVEGIKFLGD